MVAVKIILFICFISLILLGYIAIPMIREDLRYKNIPSAVALIILDITAFDFAIVAIVIYVLI